VRSGKRKEILMPTLLPRDDDNSPIPALSLRAGGAHAVAVSASSQRNAVAFGPETRVIGVFATEPAFLRLGDASVAATVSDHYFPAGIYYDLSLGSHKTSRATHIAAIRAGVSDGTLYVSEKI